MLTRVCFVLCSLEFTTEGLRERTKNVPQYETEKITRKASDVAENLKLYRGVPPEIVKHDDAFNVIL